MKLFFLFVSIFTSSQALAARWTEVVPNHGNFVYAEGEQAIFQIKNLVRPPNPEFVIQVTVEYTGNHAPVTIPLSGARGRYVSPPLPAGNSSFVVRTKLIGPTQEPNVSFEQELESTTWNISVNDL